MRSRDRIHEPHAAHFITATIIEWLPAFTTAACCDVLIRSFEHCRQLKGLRVHAWVILDNHFHAIVAGPELADTIRDFKRFTARMLLAQLWEERREWLLADSLELVRVVAGTVQHSRHGDAIVSDHVEKQVVPDRIETQSLCEVFAARAAMRVAGEQFTGGINPIELPIRRQRIVLGDKAPDFKEVELSARAAPDRRHQPRRSASQRAWAWRLIPAMSSGATSPRSISSNPILISRRNCSRRISHTSFDSLSQATNSLR